MGELGCVTRHDCNDIANQLQPGLYFGPKVGTTTASPAPTQSANQGPKSPQREPTQRQMTARGDSPADPQDASDSENLALGQNIRALRKAAGMTLHDLASIVGVSQSLVSQVERGRASPSITSLRRMATALSVPVAALFVHEASENDSSNGRKLVVRRSERKSLRVPPSRVAYELLTPDLSGNIEFIWIEYEPQTDAHPELMSHPGEENALCIEGIVVVMIEDEEFTLEAGDSISFDCGRPHKVENRSDATAILVSAITPPSF